MRHPPQMQSLIQTGRPLPHLRRCLLKALQSHPPARGSTHAVPSPLQSCICPTSLCMRCTSFDAVLTLCRNGGGAPPECSMTAVDGVDGSKPSTPMVTYRDMFLRWIWLGCACPCRLLVPCSGESVRRSGRSATATLCAAQVGWLWWPHCSHSALSKGALSDNFQTSSAAELSRSVLLACCVGAASLLGTRGAKRHTRVAVE